MTGLRERLRHIGTRERVTLKDGVGGTVEVEVRGLKADDAMKFLDMANAASKADTDGVQAAKLGAATAFLVARSLYDPETGTFVYADDPTGAGELDHAERERIAEIAMKLSGMNKDGAGALKNGSAAIPEDVSFSESPPKSEE